MKKLTYVLLVAMTAYAGGAAAAEIVPVQQRPGQQQPGPQKPAVSTAGSPMQAAGPILTAIVGIGTGALVGTLAAPATLTYPAALVGSAVGAYAGWQAYHAVAGSLVRPQGPRMAEAPSLLQLAVDTREQ